MIAAIFNSTNATHFVYGVSANAVAVLLYGSNYVPVKRIEMGDGMFFHWVSCSAMWLVSLVGDLMLQSPKFYPLAMLGGALWATGNVVAVPILKAIGFGLGVVIWACSSLLMGWATSRFEWFGVAAPHGSRPVLNHCGAALCLLSLLILFFVKTNSQLHPPPECTPLLFDRVFHHGGNETVLDEWAMHAMTLDSRVNSQGALRFLSRILSEIVNRTNSGSYGPTSPEFWMDSIGPKSRRFIGCLLAVVSGLLYGSSFVPILYIKSHSSCHDSMFHGASVYDLDYVYAQCSGIFLTSTVYFGIYCAARNNRPRVYSRAILPGLLSGLMWTLATYSWFLANNYLSAVNTFPIVSAGYGLVAALWGLLVFREFKDFANCLAFCLGSSLLITGALLTIF